MAMIKKLLFTLSLCVLAGGSLYAQSTIKGEVKDPSGNPITFLQIFLKQEDKVVNMGFTDDRGSYQLFGIPAGTYDISTGGTMTCPTTFTEKGIYVSSSEVKFVNLEINCASELEAVEVIYIPPVFNPDNTVSSQKLTSEEVRKTPGRSITAALSNLSGVASVDGNIASVRGNRDYGQQTIIDGVRVRGNGGVPMQSLEGLELIQGGIPAEYGDGTSFTILTTRGVAKDYHGGVELRSSLEGYWQTMAAASVSGPILKGKTPQDLPRMGFLIAAEGSYNLEGRPLRGGDWVAKQSTINDIIAKPVDYRYENDVYVGYCIANELGRENFKKTRVRSNVDDWGVLAQAKIDIMGGGKDARGKAKNNLRFTLGGTYQYTSDRKWDEYRDDGLFNSNNNGVYIRNTLRVYARLNHRVLTNPDANAILKNIMYDININYTLYNMRVEDKNHKDNLFAYGYIGQFKTTRRDLYGPSSLEYFNPITGDTTTINVPTLVQHQAVDYVLFDPNKYLKNGNYYNPDLVPYTQNFVDFLYDLTGGDIGKTVEYLGLPLTYELYSQFYALRNGDNPNSVALGLFTAPGVINTTWYQKARTETIAAKASLSLNIQDHEIKFGFEVEKRTDRTYSVAARNLWNRMRELTYSDAYHQLDFSRPYWKYGDPILGDSLPRITPDGNINDTLMYKLINNLSYFDQNFRARYGNKYSGITDENLFLDIDSYDPNDFSLDLFSNFELINAVTPYVNYMGYDYTGKISSKKIDLDKFFKGGDNLNEPGKYAIGAFEPVYVAFYLQDKFAISNLLFNLGLRLDYFNANQPVLRDPFLLRDAYTVGELLNHKDYSWDGFPFPDNVGSNWIPYINVADNDIVSAPHSVVAYRNGKTWYNSLGQEVADPASYLGTGGPILKMKPEAGDPSQASSNAFVNYKPQWNLMPRISFSFPVSTTSLFYAHYNIITNRATNLSIEPVKYLFVNNYQTDTRIINNPNLRAERSVDYEIGFRQKVGENTALNISAYYSEKKDQIQSYRLTGAYPNTYYSYENMDFGTVQGFNLELTMRGAKNLSFRAGYTISFAKGTGSSEKSNIAIIASGQPNLRTLTNLEFDQRHRITASINLRFDGGTSYNGPVTVKQKKGTDTKKEIRWLENSGLTLSFAAASGMPYSRSGIVYSTLGWGEQIQPQLKGSINGANMPWTFKCDLRLDKSFAFNLAGKKDQNESGKRNHKPGMLTVYLEFQNLLNLKNVQNVYDYTGSATDDGYLSSSLFRSYVEKGTAFGMTIPVARSYYDMRISNPYNYTQPFRVYLGLEFSF